MSLQTIARRYANALFDVARHHRSIEQVEQQLAALEELLTSHAELRHVFDTPTIAAPKKRALLEALLAKAPEISGEVRQLLRMLADRDRLAILPRIAGAFADRLRKARNIVEAEVVTAVPLPASQRDAVTAALRRAAGSEIAITEKVDPSIIGGVVARVGSLVFDGSVARQLDRMKQRLLQEH